MKKIVLFVILVVVVCVGCSKKTSTPSHATGTYTGIVIKNACCLIAIKTIGGGNIGQSWTDSMSAGLPHYEHAFKVANACEFGNHVAGDTISFNIIGPQVQSCMCCMLYTTTPDTVYSIAVVK